MSLQSQLQLIEQAMKSGQQNVLPALQQLFVQSHADAALAYSDLAWLHLQLALGEPMQAEREALALLEKAQSLRGDCWQALDGLAQVHHRLGDAVQAKQWTRAALQAKHDQALQATPNAQPSELARRYWRVESSLKVVAFSLFGREAFYAEAAVRNAQDVARWYPGWVCRFYVGAEVSSAVKRRLREAGAEVVMPPQAQTHLPGTVWRFMALDDLRVKTVLLRDADSQITEREVLAVQQWLVSDCQAHVMRDHAMHSELILAGLWGAQTQSLRGIGQALLDFFSRPFHATHADQHFLREWLWPRIWQDVMQHDGCTRWHTEGMPAALDFPRALRAGEEHVGHAPTQWSQLNWPESSGEPPPVLDWQLLDAQGTLLGEYKALRHGQAYPLRLPPHAVQAIETGQWRLNAITH
jgi:hypothetical protein